MIFAWVAQRLKRRLNKMTDTILTTRTIAIAAIYEVASNIKKIAWQGHQQKIDLVNLIKPVFRKEGSLDKAIEIYGAVNNISDGLICFRDSMQGNTKADREINRYVYSLIYLAGKLNKNPNMLSYINRELDHLRTLTGEDEAESDNDNFYALDDAHILRQLANIYQNSISKLGPRILISGKSEYLAQEDTAQTIRALLLSGIRSAILWDRNGGSRLKLLFNRKGYINCCVNLLAHHD